jgi:hypothetical protein
LRHVSLQDRREVGVDDRRIAAAHELDQRRDLVAHRDLRKADLARERGHALLVFGVTVGVHEHDRDCVDSASERGRKLRPDGGEIRLLLDRAIGAHTFVDLNHALVDHFRLDDVASKNFGPRLIADPKRVAESLGDEEECAFPLALEQRVGRNRGAHLH